MKTIVLKALHSYLACAVMVVLILTARLYQPGDRFITLLHPGNTLF
jgi:hypothetical protein